MKNYKSHCFRWIFSVIGALCLSGVLVASAGAGKVKTPVGPATTIENAPVSTVVTRDTRVVYDFVDADGKVISYDNTNLDARPSRGKFPGAIFDDDIADHRFILFDNISLINDLSSDDWQTLLDNFNSGVWIIGIRGYDRDLKSALDLIPPELETATTKAGGPGLAVFLYKSPIGLLNELIIAEPSDMRVRHRRTNRVAFKFMSDWYERRKAFVTDSDDPWNAITNYEWDGTTTGVYNGNNQTIGTYKFTLSPYWLDSDQNGKDWYRVDFQTISEITNYEMTGNKFGDTDGKCGWWTTKMHADGTVQTPNGEWWAYMPDTTVGSTSTSFSIGGDISTSDAGVTGSYSKTYGTSDVTIQVLANSVNQGIDWEASLSGCGGYESYPDYHGASSAAKTTYNLDPSFIIDVPAGENMVFETQTPEDQTWQLVAEKDHAKCNTTCTEIHVHEYQSTLSETKTVTCTKTGCS